LERAEIPNAACSVDINNAGTIYLRSSLWVWLVKTLKPSPPKRQE
jgi:hypothetical protein